MGLIGLDYVGQGYDRRGDGHHRVHHHQGRHGAHDKDPEHNAQKNKLGDFHSDQQPPSER